MENYTPELSRDRLTDRILEEIHRPIDNGRDSSMNFFEDPSRKLSSIERNIEVVAAHADLVESVPSMAHRRPGVRFLARAAARMILYLAKFILIPQRCINRAILDIALGLTHRAKETSERIDLLSQSLEKIRETSETIEALKASIDEMHAFSHQIQTLTHNLQEVQSVLSRKKENTAERLIQGQQLWREAYPAFEDQFRGTPEDINSRLQTHLAQVLTRVSETPGATVLDIGSGRGEWIALLRQAGIESVGLEQNPLFADDCRRRGLSVIQSEAIEYLSGLPTGSFQIVTTFHMIEHLDPGLLILFGQLVFEILKPGGLWIIETPNPENPEVSRFKFHLDPTHTRFVPKDLLLFVLEHCGFEHLSVRGLHPNVDGENDRSSQSRGLQFSDFQDYAIMGLKPE